MAVPAISRRDGISPRSRNRDVTGSEEARELEDDLPVISIAEILSILWARKLWLIGAGLVGLLWRWLIR